METERRPSAWTTESTYNRIHYQWSAGTPTVKLHVPETVSTLRNLICFGHHKTPHFERHETIWLVLSSTRIWLVLSYIRMEKPCWKWLPVSSKYYLTYLLLAFLLIMTCFFAYYERRNRVLMTGLWIIYIFRMRTTKNCWFLYIFNDFSNHSAHQPLYWHN